MSAMDVARDFLSRAGAILIRLDQATGKGNGKTEAERREAFEVYLDTPMEGEDSESDDEEAAEEPPPSEDDEQYWMDAENEGTEDDEDEGIQPTGALDYEDDPDTGGPSPLDLTSKEGPPPPDGGTAG